MEDKIKLLSFFVGITALNSSVNLWKYHPEPELQLSINPWIPMIVLEIGFHEWKPKAPKVRHLRNYLNLDNVRSNALASAMPINQYTLTTFPRIDPELASSAHASKED